MNSKAFFNRNLSDKKKYYAAEKRIQTISCEAWVNLIELMHCFFMLFFVKKKKREKSIFLDNLWIMSVKDVVLMWSFD